MIALLILGWLLSVCAAYGYGRYQVKQQVSYFFDRLLRDVKANREDEW